MYIYIYIHTVSTFYIHTYVDADAICSTIHTGGSCSAECGKPKATDRNHITLVSDIYPNNDPIL